jgi:hypothetical protein
MKIVPIDITVNTRPFKWDNYEISYEEVMTLAGHNPKHIYSICYHGEVEFDDRILSCSGTLCPGQTCNPLGGTRFDCYDTSNA